MNWRASATDTFSTGTLEVAGLLRRAATPVLPELSDVRLVWAEDNKLRLTGFEEVDGAADAQTWVVETA